MDTTWTTLLITGLRGNAKTLRAVGMMDRFVKAGVSVFASNFQDLILPGVQLLDDPRAWQSLPPGSVLFVDEAQRYWRARRSGDPSAEVIAMETQRHDAVRMVLLTQKPTFLDKHVRELVDVHEHLIRRAGLPASQLYTWERCKEDPEAPGVVELADQSVYAFETQYYGMYKSADEHTIKRKIPMRLKLALGGAVLAVSMIAWAVANLKSDVAPGAEVVAEPSIGSAVSALGSRSRERAAPLTPEQYVQAMEPRIPGAPWSAPLYDEHNEVQDAPVVACMIGSVCRCLTDQGTRYRLTQGQCRAIVRNGGVLNPFKRPERERLGAGVATSRGVADATGELRIMGRSVPEPLAVAVESPPVVASGQIAPAAGTGQLQSSTP